MLLLLLACSAPKPERSLILISLDTVSASHLALYGGRARMPKMERFAAEATVFEEAISHFPETGPSHWSILTGVLPELHGNVAGQWDSACTTPTLAERFAAGGAATGAFIGGETLKASVTGLQRGFQVYDDTVSPDPTDMRRPANEVATAATRWMSAQKEPYFAFIHYFDAHAPYTPRDPQRYDPDYAGRYDGSIPSIAPHRERQEPIDPRDLEHIRALYHAEITELDEPLARILDAAPADAVVVILADHGESFGHDYLFNHSGALWDEVLRVPLVIRAPSLTQGRVKGQVGLVDVAPTVAALVGLPEITSSGRDLREQAAGRAEGAAQVWSLTDRWIRAPKKALRTSTHKLIWEGPEGTPPRAWRHDLDPDELTPVEPPATLLDARRDYFAAVEAMRACVKSVPLRADPTQDQLKRLEALGYLEDPGGPSPGNGTKVPNGPPQPVPPPPVPPPPVPPPPTSR